MEDIPRHALTITPWPQRVQALHHGHLVADSPAAVLVREDGQPDTFYFPKQDVEMEHLAKTDLVTQSQLGTATYFTFSRDGKIWENGVWCYAEPAQGYEDLQGMVAFRPDIIDIHFVGDPEDKMWRQSQKMGDYIRHTDSGSGRSQDEPWKPTVYNARD